MKTVLGFEELVCQIFFGSHFLLGETPQERLDYLKLRNSEGTISFKFNDVEEEDMCFDFQEYCPAVIVKKCGQKKIILDKDFYHKDEIESVIVWDIWRKLRNILEVACMDERVNFITVSHLELVGVV